MLGVLKLHICKGAHTTPLPPGRGCCLCRQPGRSNYKFEGQVLQLCGMILACRPRGPPLKADEACKPPFFEHGRLKYFALKYVQFKDGKYRAKFYLLGRSSKITLRDLMFNFRLQGTKERSSAISV